LKKYFETVPDGYYLFLLLY